MWLYTNWRRNKEPPGATFQSRGRQPCPVGDPIVHAEGRIDQYNIYQYIAFDSDFFYPTDSPEICLAVYCLYKTIATHVNHM